MRVQFGNEVPADERLLSADEFLRSLRENPPVVERHRTDIGCICTSCRNNRRHRP